MTNPIVFHLDADVLDYIYEHKMLGEIKLINHYIRSFTLGVSKEEIQKIQDPDKRDYFLNHIKDLVVYARFDGLEFTGAARSAMMSALHRYLESNGNYDIEVKLLLRYYIGSDYLITYSIGKYRDALSIIRRAIEEMPQDQFNKLFDFPSDLQVEWYKRIKDALVWSIEHLQLVDPAKCEELVAKLVEYSADPHTSLPAELQQKQ